MIGVMSADLVTEALNRLRREHPNLVAVAPRFEENAQRVVGRLGLTELHKRRFSVLTALIVPVTTCAPQLPPSGVAGRVHVG